MKTMQSNIPSPHKSKYTTVVLVLYYYNMYVPTYNEYYAFLRQNIENTYTTPYICL